MEKLKNVVRIKNELNKFEEFIFDNLDSYLSGDWTEYKNGDEVYYNIDCLEVLNDYNEMGDEVCDINELKEFVGEGICYIDENWNDDKCWYNVYFKGDVLVISYVVDKDLI
jgi:hypothetical protein